MQHAHVAAFLSLKPSVLGRRSAKLHAVNNRPKVETRSRIEDRERVMRTQSLGAARKPSKARSRALEAVTLVGARALFGISILPTPAGATLEACPELPSWEDV